jgi:GNAT superfamily N-acetyltransferase
MEIDSATEADVGALLPMMRAYCDFYGASPSDEGLMKMARELIAARDADGMLLVARDGDGAPIGFATVCWKWSSLRAARIAVMEDLFVAEEARGRGTADDLIRACGDRAREHGAPVITWLTAPDNHRAQAVYNRAGAGADTFLEYELELG